MFLIAVLDPAQADLVKLHYQIQVQRNLFYFKRLPFTNWPSKRKNRKLNVRFIFVSGQKAV